MVLSRIDSVQYSIDEIELNLLQISLKIFKTDEVRISFGLNSEE